MRGLIKSIAAPVVPIQLASTVPIKIIPVFNKGVPTNDPFKQTPPEIVNNDNNKMIKGIYSSKPTCRSSYKVISIPIGLAGNFSNKNLQVKDFDKHDIFEQNPHIRCFHDSYCFDIICHNKPPYYFLHIAIDDIDGLGSTNEADIVFNNIIGLASTLGVPTTMIQIMNSNNSKQLLESQGFEGDSIGEKMFLSANNKRRIARLTNYVLYPCLLKNTCLRDFCI